MYLTMYFLLTSNILLGKKVKNEVQLASLSTIYTIENADSTEEAIKTCGFLKFVSFDLFMRFDHF